MKRLIPDTIATRTLLVLLIGLTVSHILSMALYRTERESQIGFATGAHVAERITMLFQLVEGASSPERRRIVALADSPELHVFLSDQSAITGGPPPDYEVQLFGEALGNHFGNADPPTFRLAHARAGLPKPWQANLPLAEVDAGDGGMLLTSLQMNDGSWLNFAAPVSPPAILWSFRFALSLAVMLAAVIALALLVVRRTVEPLATFALAAERLGADVAAPAIPERGPAEVRQAIRAFNRMQSRIRRFVDDRTQMLAAISHDLGTPITRLRLRAEFVDDDEQRTKMHADLDEMERMVFASLAFAREETASEPRAVVDLRSMLQRICDAAVDAGHDVALGDAADAIPYKCQPSALRRALTNLVDNAVKYGDRARVSLTEANGAVIITVDDEGPGIPEDLREEAFKPFHRLEESRNAETGGTGLGLSLARTVVRAHGGDISLSNRTEVGLHAEVRLPVERAK